VISIDINLSMLDALPKESPDVEFIEGVTTELVST